MKEEAINKLIEYIEQSKDFLLEELPIVAQQALKYEKISTLLNVFLMSILICGALILCYCCWKNPRLDEYKKWEVSSIMGVMIPLFISPFLFVQLCYSIDKLVKIYIAPKYFLIKLVASLRS